MCHLLALLGAHHIFHISRIRVKAEMKILTENLRTTIIKLILNRGYCIATGWLSVRYFANCHALLSLGSFSGVEILEVKAT
jgi:predicted transcriptional regulator